MEARSAQDLALVVGARWRFSLAALCAQRGILAGLVGTLKVAAPPNSGGEPGALPVWQ
jgi:hypothetical protein